jgi:hypothetical protein
MKPWQRGAWQQAWARLCPAGGGRLWPQDWADVVSPDWLAEESDHVRLADGRLARTLAVVAYPRRVEVDWLRPLYAFPAETRWACHIEPVDTAVAVSQLNRHARTLRASLLLSEARRGQRDPFDEAALEDAVSLRDGLARGRIRLFCFHLAVTLFAPDRPALERLTAALIAEMESRLLRPRPCLFQQLDGFAHTLPLGRVTLPCPRNLDSEAVATTLPFVAGDFQQPGDEVWGRDLRHHSLVAVPRWRAANAHVIAVAASGAGKSFWLKSLLTQNLLARREAIVFDPQGEYGRWCQALGGRLVVLGPGGHGGISALPPPPAEAPAPTQVPGLGPPAAPPLPPAAEEPSAWSTWRSLCAERLLAALQLLGDLGASERALAREAAHRVSRLPGGPTLTDLLLVLERFPEAGALARRLRTALAAGLSAFTAEADDAFAAPLVVFDVSRIVRAHPPAAAATYYLLAEAISDHLALRSRAVTVAVDEAHHLLAHAPSASLVERLFRTGRKQGVGVCLVTQSVGDLLGEQAEPAAARATRAALANAATAFFMRQQNAREVEWLQRLYRLHPTDAAWLLTCGRGEGLALCGERRARTRVEAPPDLEPLFGPDEPAAAGPLPP